MGPSHADQIQQAFFDCISCGRNIIDAGCVHYRQIKVTPDFAGKFKMRRLRRTHVGYQVGKAYTGCAMAAVDIKEVNHSSADQNLANAHAFIELKATIKRFIKHHPDTNNVVIPNLSANFF